MVDSRAGGCLEPEVLAAYADRGLSLAERARVEAHLASCPRCTALLAGVVRTVAELGPDTRDVDIPVPTPAVQRRAVMGATAAAAAVIAVLATPAVLRPWLEYDTELVSLAGSVGEHRSVLGRLAGGFPHAPLRGPSAGGQDGQATGTDRVLLTSGRIRESFGERATASQLHAQGVASLLTRRYDDAARLLLAASREQPANARYLNDVATVQLERARLGLRPDDLPRALAAAERATRLDPSLKEAWFNRALAIDALSLNDQAKAAWTEYLRRDGASPWAGEARQRLEELMKPTAAEAWEAIEGRLQQSIDPATADEAVRTQTTQARNFIERDLFVAWANAVLAGGAASAELDRIRTMAEAMLRVTGDGLYRDSVAAATQATAPQLKQLAAAHLRFAEASTSLINDQYADAASALTAAEALFAQAGSPFAVRASVDLGATGYIANRYDETSRRLAAVRRIAAAKAYAYVSARAAWFEGMIAFAQGRLGDSQAHYEETLATFERIGDAEQVVAAHTLLAAYHFYLGNTQNEWRHRQSALQGLSVTRSPRLKFQVLASTATSLRFDQPESAIAFHDAALATLQGGGRSASRVEVLASRAHTLISLGRLSDAAVTIAEARRELESVTDPAFHQLLELVVLSPEGELQRRSDPAAAAATAERALRIMAERKSPSDRSRLPHFQLQLAKANIASGREQLAEHALGEGIRAFEEERAAITDEGLISAFDPKWELLETGIELAIRKGELERAFALSERARARSLAESRRAPEAWSLAEIRAALDPDVAIVALNQFEHELAVWVIRRDIATVTMRPLSRLDAERLVSRQHEEIWRESTTALAGRELYNEILRPTVTELRGAARVVFIPDATFENAAFSALWDPARRRFLVEDFAVAVAPSAESYMSAAMRDADAWQSELLIVGGPTSVSSANVAAIAPLYRAANVVTGASATGTRFLSDAPKHTVIHVVAETTTHKTHPLLSRITLADEPGRPYTGVVLGRDIAAKSMSATKFVVLDESRTSIEQRGEGTLKLARAFMTAGVPAVLGTLPGADEHATRDLMIGFHREMTTGITPGQALARVQRNALQQNGRRLGAWTALVIYGSDR